MPNCPPNCRPENPHPGKKGWFRVDQNTPPMCPSFMFRDSQNIWPDKGCSFDSDNYPYYPPVCYVWACDLNTTPDSRMLVVTGRGPHPIGLKLEVMTLQNTLRVLGWWFLGQACFFVRPVFMINPMVFLWQSFKLGIFSIEKSEYVAVVEASLWGKTTVQLYIPWLYMLILADICWMVLLLRVGLVMCQVGVPESRCGSGECQKLKDVRMFRVKKEKSWVL